MIITDHMSVPVILGRDGEPYDPYRSVPLIVGLDGKPLLRARPMGELYDKALMRSATWNLDGVWARTYLGTFHT